VAVVINDLAQKVFKVVKIDHFRIAEQPFQAGYPRTKGQQAVAHQLGQPVGGIEGNIVATTDIESHLRTAEKVEVGGAGNRRIAEAAAKGATQVFARLTLEVCHKILSLLIIFIAAAKNEVIIVSGGGKGFRRFNRRVNHIGDKGTTAGGACIFLQVGAAGCGEDHIDGGQSRKEMGRFFAVEEGIDIPQTDLYLRLVFSYACQGIGGYQFRVAEE